jgi:hypothetical protein
MCFRVARVSAAIFAMLTAAAACLAQDLPVTSNPVSVDTAATRPAATTPARPRVKGIGSMGGSLGVSAFIADADYSSRRNADGTFGDTDVRERFSFAATFRYGMTSSLRWQISPGYTWTGYTEDSPIPFTDPNFPADATKEKMLTQVLPVTAQLQWVVQRGGWLYHIGSGPGVYRVWVQNRRKVLKDPVSKKLHRGFYPGASGELGASRALKGLPGTELEFSLGGHWIFAERDEQFPSGFNSFLSFLDARVGLHYTFDPKLRFRRSDSGGAAGSAPR